MFEVQKQLIEMGPGECRTINRIAVLKSSAMPGRFWIHGEHVDLSTAKHLIERKRSERPTIVD